MKRYKAILAIGLAATLAFSSCEDLVTEVELPEYEPKLVLTSFISPEGKSIRVNLGESFAVFGPQNSGIENPAIMGATVILKGPQHQSQIPWSEEQYAYYLDSLPWDIQANTEYELSATLPDGRSIEGKCSIPADLNTSLEITDIELGSGGEFGQAYIVQFRITDLPGEGHFYRVGGYMHYKWDEGNDETYTMPLYLSRGDEYISDVGKDGSTMSFRVDADMFGGEAQKLELFLLTTDEAYYRYHNTLDNYWGDDPFSEPTLIYSNIEDGLGVFAAYRSYHILIDLENNKP
jgi:hypothetical protein